MSEMETACSRLVNAEGVVTEAGITATRLEGLLKPATAEGLGYFMLCSTCENQICVQPGERLFCRLNP